MALRNGLFRDLGSTRGWEWGSFPCHGQKKKKIHLKLPFLVTLEHPRFTKGQFPPKIPRPAGQTKLRKNIWRRCGFNKKKTKNRFIGQFIKLTREFDSIRSRSANIVISTFTNNYLVLANIQSSCILVLCCVWLA